MDIRTFENRSNKYFEDKDPNQVTLAGLTRALDFEEGDIELLLDEKQGRKTIMNIYLRLAEIIETQSNLKPSIHRSHILKGIDKFIGNLYSYDDSSNRGYIKAKTNFASIDAETQKKLMQSIANRNAN